MVFEWMGSVLTRCSATAPWAVLLLVGVLGFAPATYKGAHASDVRLIMVEEKGCRFCRKWHAEVGHVYPKSREGRFAPLRRVKRGAPDIKGLNPVAYTPTFILMRSGEEVGRITGYPGKDYFWIELAPLLGAAGFIPSQN